jgi:hypothetical protein
LANGRRVKTQFHSFCTSAFRYLDYQYLKFSVGLVIFGVSRIFEYGVPVPKLVGLVLIKNCVL